MSDNPSFVSDGGEVKDSLLETGQGSTKDGHDKDTTDARSKDNTGARALNGYKDSTTKDNSISGANADMERSYSIEEEKPKEDLGTDAISKTTYGSIDVEVDEQLVVEVDSKVELNNGEVRTVVEEVEEDLVPQTDLLYTVDEPPPWYLCCFFGFQHYLVMVVATVSIPFILTPLLCIDDSDPVRGRLVCTIIFVSGLITLLQSTFGVRLPIIQGGTFSFLVPTMALLNTAYPKCQDLPLANMTQAERTEVWQTRMREVQGSIIIAGLFQFTLGFSGLIGLMLSWITPLTIVPLIVVIGLTLFNVATKLAALHWGISVLTILLMIVFSQFLKEVPLPIPGYSRQSGCYVIWFQVFKLFSLLLAIVVSWLFCFILTISEVLPEGNKARTDASLDLIRNSPWITVPYPGQWGLPTVSLAGVLGMMSGMVSSMVESVGDYYVNARIAGAAPPPTHAMNRGIGIEGIGGILAGLFGSGNGTTSVSINTGAIGITKVGSRRVIQMAAMFMILFGMFGKFGAVFVSIPSPVIGGMFCILFPMIVAVGFSALHFVDLNSTRNLFILGFSIFMGLAVPKWMENNPGAIDSGILLVDQVVTVLLSTSMLIGGFLGCILDNFVPGTLEERGLVKWRAQFESKKGEEKKPVSTYDIPFCTEALRRASWSKYLPFSPTFTGFTKR